MWYYCKVFNSGKVYIKNIRDSDLGITRDEVNDIYILKVVIGGDLFKRDVTDFVKNYIKNKKYFNVLIDYSDRSETKLMCISNCRDFLIKKTIDLLNKKCKETERFYDRTFKNLYKLSGDDYRVGG